MALNSYVSPQSYVQDNEMSLRLPLDFVCITNRTQEDVDRIRALTDIILSGEYTEQEWNEFKTNSRGALNYSDLDRIEHNLEKLSNWIHISLVDMSRPAIPRVPYFNNLLENVRRVRNSGYRFSYTPEVPEKPLNTYQKINDIETILLHAYRMWLVNYNSDVYCGNEMICGDSLLI